MIDDLSNDQNNCQDTKNTPQGFFHWENLSKRLKGCQCKNSTTNSSSRLTPFCGTIPQRLLFECLDGLTLGIKGLGDQFHVFSS